MKFIVTVKLPKNPTHNPKAKKVGACPLQGKYCTDITGEHHSVLIEATDLDHVVRTIQSMGFSHITRVESV